MRFLRLRVRGEHSYKIITVLPHFFLHFFLQICRLFVYDFAQIDANKIERKFARRFKELKAILKNALNMNQLIDRMYGVRNPEKTIRFSLKYRPSERFHRPEMSQIKAEISLCTNMKLIFHKM